jgi:hypothetical protein
MARPKPTAAQVKAVRAVLYKRERLQRILADQRSIEVLMNLNNPAQPNGSPTWLIEATGETSVGVTEAASRCQRIAAAFREMSREITPLRLPAADKSDLRTALNEQAIVWERRGAIWGAKEKPDPGAAVAELKSHLTSAVQALARVVPYLRRTNDISELVR